VALSAGGEETFLKNDSHIEITQSAIVLEEVIGQFVFSQAGKQNSDNSAKF